MYLCRELTELSLPKIGQQFGGRDHTTVMHADRKIRSLMAERRSIYNQVTELTTGSSSRRAMAEDFPRVMHRLWKTLWIIGTAVATERQRSAHAMIIQEVTVPNLVRDVGITLGRTWGQLGDNSWITCGDPVKEFSPGTKRPLTRWTTWGNLVDNRWTEDPRSGDGLWVQLGSPQAHEFSTAFTTGPVDEKTAV